MITRIDHIGIAVEGLARHLPFWSEVMGLRVVAQHQALEVQWCQPAGARQVLIERWAGSPEDRPEQPASVPEAGPGLLVDSELQDGQLYSYRFRCVYDGPEGQFLTPGITCSAAAGEALDRDRDAASSATRGS